MAIYHIKRYGPAPEEQPEQSREFWRERHAWHTRDLDFGEIEDINRQHPLLPDDAPADDEVVPIRPFRRPWVAWLLAVLVILGFAAMGALGLFSGRMDFSVLKRSNELAEDEALSSLRQAVVVVECGGHSGSGFNISADGLIVTNRHVVESGGVISVGFSGASGGGSYVAGNYTEIPGVDLALVDIDGEGLPTVSLSYILPEAGDPVIFIGNPLGYDWTISEGQFQGLVRFSEEDAVCIWLSGPVQAGSSGSPVFNSDGQVIGVIFATIRGEDNSGLAIPIAYLQSFLEDNENER